MYFQTLQGEKSLKLMVQAEPPHPNPSPSYLALRSVAGRPKSREKGFETRFWAKNGMQKGL